MVIVKLLDLYFPRDSVSFCIVFKRNREVAALVELAERSWTWTNWINPLGILAKKLAKK